MAVMLRLLDELGIHVLPENALLPVFLAVFDSIPLRDASGLFAFGTQWPTQALWSRSAGFLCASCWDWTVKEGMEQADGVVILAELDGSGNGVVLAEVDGEGTGHPYKILHGSTTVMF